MSDTAAILNHLSKNPFTDISRVGCVGYCMSGQYALNACTHFPAQIKAAASFYGTRMVTDDELSPHKVILSAPPAEIYVGCAEVDKYAPPEIVETLQRASHETIGKCQVDIYPGAEHGFAFPLRPQYDESAAERHWQRLLDLFARQLKG